MLACKTLMEANVADGSRFINATEYLRRNSAHANAVGAHANTKAALARLLTMKRPPMWLVAALEGIERRTAIVHPEVAAWRDSAPDNPYGVEHPHPPHRTCPCAECRAYPWKDDGGVAELALADEKKKDADGPSLP